MDPSSCTSSKLFVGCLGSLWDTVVRGVSLSVFLGKGHILRLDVTLPLGGIGIELLLFPLGLFFPFPTPSEDFPRDTADSGSGHHPERKDRE